MTQSQLVDTEDMGLAIALTCHGYVLVDLEPNNEKRVTFRFQDGAGINKAAQAYWNGRLNVDAKQFWHESKNLKARLYSLR